MRQLIEKWKTLDRKKRVTVFAVTGGVCLAGIAAAIGIHAANGSETEVTYRETEVKYGKLSVGVTESGSVDIGTVEQTFDLDMSELQRASTGESASGSSNAAGAGGPGGMGGGMNMFDQIFSMADGAGSSKSTSSSSLVVSGVCVSVGQQVSEGDVLYELEEDSVSELTQQLESDVEKAKADLEAVYADQELSRQTAQYTYDTSVAYGDYAQTEYDTTVVQLEQAVQDAERQLETAQTTLADYGQQLSETTALYEEAVKRLEDCKWGVENCDKQEDTYNYVTVFQLMESAQSAADTLEAKKERLESSVEQAQSNVETAQSSLAKAKRSYAQGLLSSQQTYELRQLAYDTAQETYDIALAYLETDAREQEETYADTLEKWEEYSSHVDGTSIRSQYDGVITGIGLEEGDSISTGTVLVTLYDRDEVTMTVTVDETDMTDIALGSEAAVNFTAYPAAPFRATVSEIADAEADSSGNITYDVTVTLQGDVSGLFQGMTGDITFITEETAEVLYVSRRAVITDGDETYVKVRDAGGAVKRVQVTTGFTDGTYTEITGGLSEGDVVLIESKVTK